MCQPNKKAKYECCGETFNTKQELEAHKSKMHTKSCGCGCGCKHE